MGEVGRLPATLIAAPPGSTPETSSACTGLAQPSVVRLSDSVDMSLAPLLY